MKKQILLFVLAFIGIVGTVFGQTPATLPYNCDFEAEGDNGWVLKNGSCLNKWYVGTPAGAESASLYISGDGGTTAGYNDTSFSIVVAEKLFQTDESDSLVISFDLTIGGEFFLDFLKVFWVPVDTNYEAIAGFVYVDYASSDYSTNVITRDLYVSELYGTQNMKTVVANTPNSLKKLVFLWRNNNTRSRQPGAIIDNIKIVPFCHSVIDLSANNITETSAEISWNGSESSYEVSLNDGEPETVTTTSKTFTDLAAGTIYSVKVRSVCASSNSQWTTIKFTTGVPTQTPTALPYSCDFEEADENGWILKNGECINKWYIGIPSGAENASLYISGDSGTTAGYNTSEGSIIVAEKLFQTGTSDSLYISFDLTIGGSEYLHYLKVFWIPADTNYYATLSGKYYSSRYYALNTIMNNAEDASYHIVSLLDGTQRMTATLANEPNSLKKLVFVWSSSSSRGVQPGAIIDNIIIAETNCPHVTDLAVNNITATSAEISWNGSASNYEVRLNGGAIETVTSTSKTFAGLTTGTEYLVEVRTVCDSSHSAWIRTKFTTAAILPYSCDFEEAGNNDWKLKNSFCTNQWHVGTFSSPDGHSGSLFLSGDGGATAGYKTNSASIVVAEKLFQTDESDSLRISFDLTIGGKDYRDYLKVFWVPADTNYEAIANYSAYYANTYYAPNVIIRSSNRYVNLLEGTQNMRAVVANEPNSLKKLVFVWRNDGSSGSQQPGAIIDNIKIAPTCPTVTDLTVSNITETSAEVSWNGGTDSYEIRINGGEAETLTTTSKTLTGLANSTIYTFEVRGVCPEMDESYWQTVTFCTHQTPATLPYTCDFEAEGDNGWIARNRFFQNKWFIGTPGGETNRSLYLSGDNGATACMDTNGYTSLAIAEKLFQTDTSEYINIRFDLQMDERFNTENGTSILRVFWAPADSIFDVVLNPLFPYFQLADGDNVIMNNCTMYNTTLFCTHGFGERTEMNTTIVNEPNSLKKLVFIWIGNDYDNFVTPIIDNISIKGVNEPCNAPTDLAVSNVSLTEATVNWNGSASNYEVRFNGVSELVSGTSKTLTGLTPGESYSVQVRAICNESRSQWERLHFNTSQHPASIPYFCDFETAYNNGWTLKNNTCLSRWYVGTPDSATNASLYISKDNGATAGYNIGSGSVVVAEKLFQTGTSDSLTISFDLTIGGRESHHYLKVYWVPADTNYEAIAYEIPYYSMKDYVTNVIMSNAQNTACRYVCELSGTQRMSVTVANEPNSLKKLVFVWSNDDCNGDQPGAVIDNLSIAENSDGSAEQCNVPTALSVSNITETEATVNWNGEASAYEIKLNGAETDTVSGTSVAFTNLSAGSAYIAEVRTICENGNSAWVGINFKTIPTCDAPTDIAVNNITATSAEVSWNGTAYEYQIRINGGATDTTTATSKTFTDLTNGTEYTVEVRAVCEHNESVWDTVRFTTLCSSVTDLAVGTITATSAEISWNGSANGYEVRLNGGDVETISTTNKTFTDLTEETKYTVEVRAVCADNESAWDVVRFTTASRAGLAQVAADMKVFI